MPKVRVVWIPRCDLFCIEEMFKILSNDIVWQFASQALYSLHHHAELSHAIEMKKNILFQRNHNLNVKSINKYFQ